MKKSFLLETVDINCPFCGIVHPLEKRKRQATALIKNEPVIYEEEFYRCLVCGNEEENEFVTAKMMDDNLQNARNSYRKKKGLLTSDEIAAIRTLYGMSQSDLARLLGWGDITVTWYESKSIQDETYDQMMRMVRDDPAFVYTRLKAQKDAFSDDKFLQLKQTVQHRIEEVGLCNLKRREIENYYTRFEDPSDANGYQRLDLNKLGNIMAFFAQYYSSLYKVKLMKLLWYVDALAFQHRKQAVTGLVYLHKPYGALPLANSEIIYLPQLLVEEIEMGDAIGYHIMPKSDGLLKDIQPDEIDIIYKVAQKFKNMSTVQIVHYMHEEDAYQKTEMHQIIPFSLCSTLKDF